MKREVRYMELHSRLDLDINENIEIQYFRGNQFYVHSK